MKVITQEDVQTTLPRRRSDSHKGENGRVLIISGHSEFSGAAVLAGMGALYSGADLVKLYVPEVNVEVSRKHCPEFIVRGFPGDVFEEKHIDGVRDWLDEADCVVIGPGSKPEPGFLDACEKLLEEDKLFVLDSSAIFALKKDAKKVLVTPHTNEYEKFSKVTTNILLKGQVDTIMSYEGDVVSNKTGDPGMTVGGSGDVLAGLCASMIAQGLNPFEAAQVAAFMLGKAGEKLSENNANAYSAKDLAQSLPKIFSQLVS